MSTSSDKPESHRLRRTVAVVALVLTSGIAAASTLGSTSAPKAPEAAEALSRSAPSTVGPLAPAATTARLPQGDAVRGREPKSSTGAAIGNFEQQQILAQFNQSEGFQQQLLATYNAESQKS